MVNDQGVYFGHQPIYGIGNPNSEPGHMVRFARTLQILKALDGLEFGSLLDVGGGEGFVAHLSHEVFGCEAAVCDLSSEGMRRAHDLFGLDSIAVSSSRLPFADDAFDVVVCSEVIEHVEFPVETLLELKRVARNAVVLTTEEICHDRKEIDHYLFRRCGAPHFELNLYHPDDLRSLFGDAATFRHQFRGVLPTDDASMDVVRSGLEAATADDFLDPRGAGGVMVSPQREGVRREKPAKGIDHIFEVMLRPVAVLEPLARRQRDDLGDVIGPRVVCPLCRSRSVFDGQKLSCTACAATFDFVDAVLLCNLTIPDPTREQLVDYLAGLWPLQTERVAATLGLRDALAMPSDPDKRVWDLSVEAERRGWMPNETLEELSDDPRRFCLRATDNDAWIASPGFGLPVGEIVAARIRMSIHNPAYGRDAGVGQLYWMCDGDEAFEEERCVTFPVINDGELHDYEVTLAGQAAWPTEGELLCLRLDPANAECAIEFGRFELVTRP